MLRNNICHNLLSTNFLCKVSVGNLVGYLENNTVTLSFDMSETTDIQYHFTRTLSIATLWNQGDDLTGVTKFKYLYYISKNSSDTEDCNYVECLDAAGYSKFYTSVSYDKVTDVINVSLTLLNTKVVTNLYISSVSNEIVRDSSIPGKYIGYSISKKDINSLANLSYVDTISRRFNNSPHEFISKDPNRIWLLSGLSSNYMNVKSIAIPKWVAFVDISVTSTNTYVVTDNDVGNNVPFNIPIYTYCGVLDALSKTPKSYLTGLSISYVPIDLKKQQIIKDDTLTCTTEDILKYDGEDPYTYYFHIESTVDGLNSDNYIRIIGSVKKKFRVLCHKIHKILNYIHNFNHIKSFPYKNYEIGGDLIC